MLGELLLELSQAPEPTAGSIDDGSSEGPPGAAPIASRPAPIRPPEIRGPRSVVPLRIGDSIQHIEVRGGGEGAIGAAAAAAERPAAPGYDAAHVLPELPDLEALASRCEHAARAARFAAGTTPQERTPEWRVEAGEFVQRAIALGNSRGPWSLESESAFDRAALVRLADCFDNVARAARVISLSRKDVEGSRLVEPRSTEEREIILLLAEAQSALRIAAEPFGQSRDEDQYTAFRWLRLVTERERIYLDRFMRMDDPGDPHAAAELSERVSAVEQSLSKRKEARTEHKSRRGKIRYHVKRLLADPDVGDPADWNSLGAAMSQLMARGESAAAMNSLIADLRQSRIWQHAPAQLAEALAAADEDDGAAPPREYGPSVHRVRDWLRGSRVVVIGGERRPDAAARIAGAFDLADLEWVGLGEHSSSAPLRPEIMRAETKLVLVLVKLAGHAHVEDSRRWSREAGKPCVLLRAGYNPEQIAASILEQVSDLAPAPDAN